MGLSLVAYLPSHPDLLAAVEVGGYANGYKCIPLFIIMLIWARMLTWQDKDSQEAFLPRVSLNMGFAGGMILALILFFLLPGFWIAFPVFFLFFAGEITTYLVLRQKKVGLSDLDKQFREWLSSFGKKKDLTAITVVGQVSLIGKNGTAVAVPDAESPHRAAYDAAQTVLLEPLRKGAESIQLAQEEGGAVVRFAVDGVGYDGATLSKTDAGEGVGLLKQLAGLDVAEKRKPQMGTIKVSVDSKKRELRVKTRGNTAGESATIEVDLKSRHILPLGELGLSDSQMKAVADVSEGGVVLAATPKGQGLTSLLYGLVRQHDAFIAHIHSIERAPDDELEGLTQNKLAVDAPAAEELKLAGWVISQDPDVLLVDRVDDPRTAAELIKYAGQGKRIYVGISAGTTFDALAAWRKLVGDDKLATTNVELVIAGRLLRKLCMACKIEYSPDPETLRRLNMSPDKISRLFQARTQPMLDPKGVPMVCDFCKDLRYKGRVGVFETFSIDDEVRQIVQAGGSVNQLKMLFKKQKRKYLQEQAVAKAVAGDTSLQEVARALKTGEASSSSESRTTAPARASSRSKPSKPSSKA